VDSRAVDGHVYTVVQNDLWVPPPEVTQTDDGTSVYESEADYRARLDEAFANALPGYTTTDYTAGGATGEGSLVTGANLYIPDTVDNAQLLSVAVFDPAAGGPGPVAVTTVAGTSGEGYA